eukprot:Gb_24645 [translate_table: standard]
MSDVQAGLDVSLFNHLQQCGLRSYLLDTQYRAFMIKFDILGWKTIRTVSSVSMKKVRMHPALAAFPSAMFYSGHLASYPLPSDRPAPQGASVRTQLDNEGERAVPGQSAIK